MFTLEDIQKMKEDFYLSFTAGVEGITEEQVLAPFHDGDAQAAREVIKSIYNHAVLSFPDELGVPGIRQDYSISEEEDLRVNIQLRSKDSLGKSLSQSQYFSGISTLENLLAWVSDAFQVAITLEARKLNLGEINEVVARLNKEAGNEFDVEFVDSPSAVVSISNDKVVLGISELILTSYDSKIIFQEPVEFSPEDIEAGEVTNLEIQTAEDFNARYHQAWEQAKAIWAAATPVEFIQNRSDLMKVLSNLRLKKLNTLLRGSISKNVPWLARTEKDIRVKYDVDGVFAIVERRDGILEVDLNPVDVVTGEPVDIDVLAKVEELLA